MSRKLLPLNFNNNNNSQGCSLLIIKRSLFIKLLLVISIIINNSIILFCQSALLTNIYNNKLSELTDISHRFLLVPSNLTFSPSPSSSHLSQEAQTIAFGSAPKFSESEKETSPSPLSNNNYEEERFLSRQNVGDSSPENAPKEQLPLALPLIATSQQQSANSFWSKQQQSNQSALNKASSNKQEGPTSSRTNNSSLSSGNPGSPVVGEPNVNENVSTEFPNPNINNLGHEITKILKKFFLHGYDKRVRPNYSGPPALVNVSFHIIGISSVDEVQMDFTTDFYFRQKWYDPRLEFNPVGEIDELCVGAEFAEKIWLPDTFFANEKTATFHKATTENTFIRIAHTGRVYRSIRLTVTCSCPMDLQYFPMDRQRCKIEIESYGYNTRDIDYRWERGDASVTLNTKIELPQFKILGFKMGQELQNLSSGDYIRLYCEIHFVRSMGYYLIQIYIPASLIVMISWVSFWLHRNATPARVALGVTTVLTMTTLMSSTNAALPKISYIKSIDVFLGTCFVMVFASLLEYASVGYIGKRIAMKRKRLQDFQQMQQHHQKVCVAAAASAAAAAAAVQESNPLLVSNNIVHINKQHHQFINNNNNNSHNNSLIVTGQLPMMEQQADTATKQQTQTLQRKSLANSSFKLIDGSKTLQRNPSLTTTSMGANKGQQNSSTLNYDQSKADREISSSAMKVVLDASEHNNNNINPDSHYHESRTTTTLPGIDMMLTNTKKMIGGVNRRRLNNPISPAGENHNQAHHINNPNSTRTPLLAAGAAIAAAANQSSGHGPTTEFEVSQTHDMIKICGLTPSAIDKHSRVVFPICFVCFNLMYWIIYGHISQQIEDKGPPLIPFIKS